jgi:hypothetical protein
VANGATLLVEWDSGQRLDHIDSHPDLFATAVEGVAVVLDGAAQQDVACDRKQTGPARSVNSEPTPHRKR